MSSDFQSDALEDNRQITVTNDEESQVCPRCGVDAGDNWFDRDVCPEPCGGCTQGARSAAIHMMAAL